VDDLMQKRGSKLDRMRELDQSFGSPSRDFRKIHVAGTNGKGSVCTKIASAFTQLGYKTGLYTSPHIETFHERIQIDGKMISQEEASFFLTKILEISKDATFFEVVTMLAFLYFQSKKVDFAIIETGLGGSLDPTNIIQPELSIITSISYDHMEILGDTLDEIAENKAGIIKLNTSVLLGSKAALATVLQKAVIEKAPLYIMPPIDDYIEENTELAKKAVSLFFPQAISLDFSPLPPCRFEVMDRDGLTIVFDIAHNKDALEKLFTKLQITYPGRSFFVIFGMSQDKCVDFAITYIKNLSTAIYPFDVENPRIMRREDLATLFDSKTDTLDSFLKNADENNGIVIVTGSAYIMHAAKEAIFMNHSHLSHL
jgi:dihydrofolate synthase / folylpolyglutamate synthase